MTLAMLTSVLSFPCLQVQDALTDLASFSKLVTLAAFSPFASAADALNQINSVSEGRRRTR